MLVLFVRVLLGLLLMLLLLLWGLLAAVRHGCVS